MNTRLPSSTVSLLTGGIDRHYATELSTALAATGITLDVICNSEMDTPKMRKYPGLRLLPLYQTPRRRNPVRKLLACLGVYVRLLRYITNSGALVIHTLWNYKFPLADRTLLLLYCKLLGKRLVFTAHNVNAAERDGVDSRWNRWSLRTQYSLVDHIFVHTEQMKNQLLSQFAVPGQKVTVIPYGVYSRVPNTQMTKAEARERLGLASHHRTLLFFGRIVPYKGINYLVQAFESLATNNSNYRLLIAGEPMKEAEQHWRQSQQKIEESPTRNQVIQHIRHIEDGEIEVYFKAADVLVLPYTQIFQSGVLFMAYSFGLPVIAADVGSFGKDILPGETGYLCRPQDPEDLARISEVFFSSDLYRELEKRRPEIQSLILASNSWHAVAEKTAKVYAALCGDEPVQFKASAKSTLTH